MMRVRLSFVPTKRSKNKMGEGSFVNLYYEITELLLMPLHFPPSTINKMINDQLLCFISIIKKDRSHRHAVPTALVPQKAVQSAPVPSGRHRSKHNPSIHNYTQESQCDKPRVVDSNLMRVFRKIIRSHIIDILN